jgi:uncharacterized protein YggT (Ycf19 family)
VQELQGAHGFARKIAAGQHLPGLGGHGTVVARPLNSPCELELEKEARSARVSQVVDYVFFLIYSLIALEVGLELLGARESSGFKRFLDAVTAPILAPFRGLMPDPSVGSFQLMISYVVAAIVYLVLHQAVKCLLRMVAGRASAVS